MKCHVFREYAWRETILNSHHHSFMLRITTSSSASTPIKFVLQAMREFIRRGWFGVDLWEEVLACLLLAGVMFEVKMKNITEMQRIHHLAPGLIDRFRTLEGKLASRSVS